MGVTSGLCGVDEFHDEVSGLCGLCSDVCRDISKPDNFCIYHCADYYGRLLSTTAIALQDKKTMTLVWILVLVSAVLVCTVVISIVITLRYRHVRLVHIRKHKQYKVAGHQNSKREFTGTRFRRKHRTNRHSSVQETRDPNKEEDMQLAVLCISPCSSLTLRAESITDGIMPQSSTAQPLNHLHLNQARSKHRITINAIVSAEDVSFEETQPKILCDTESASSSLSNKRRGELAKTLGSNSDENCTSDAYKARPTLHSEHVMKHFDVVHSPRLYCQHDELDNSEAANAPVEETYTLTSIKGVHSEHEVKMLRAPFQESCSVISKGGPS